MDSLYQNTDINILIIDDNAKNIQIIGQELQAQGYNVSFATSGPEALDILKTPEFDLILLDILMPGMDGFEVCKRIKSKPKAARIPIIFLTAKADKQSVVKGFRLGANDYVAKPFNGEELLLRVKTQIDLMKQKEKMENLNQVLAERVKEKTAEITLANQKLMVLEKAKSDFLTLISHEMRTPLNIINGFTEILRESLRHTDQHMEELDNLKSSTDTLISLSETALLITEIQLGKYEISQNEVHLKDVCQNKVSQAEYNFRDNNFKYHITTVGSHGVVCGDERLISDIVGKITENAILTIGNGCVINYTISGNENETKLIITDNGPGFSQSDLDRLFNTFSKEGPDLRRQGFGLGLAAAKLAMDLHSGSIHAENLPDGGAAVTLIFPDCSNLKK